MAHSSIIVEKPIGNNLQSSIDINESLALYFNENQIFRIDHYLGKEAVQNLLALRFGNIIFEKIWSNVAVDHVQITVAETLGLDQLNLLTHSKMNINSSVKFQSAKVAVLPGSIAPMTEAFASGDANRKGDL